jgi:glycosyltransferase involved in cell wall biosynthesis
MTAPAQTERPLPVAGEAPAQPDAIRALQLGLGWFAEQPGGLQRYYQELVRHLPAAGVMVRGLVCGSTAVERESQGIVSAAIPSNALLIRRLAAFRRAIKREMAEFRPDVVVSHFALYAWPVLHCLEGRPLVVHFHGPWHAECRAEGSGRLKTWMKYRVEHAVYHRADRLITLSHAFKNVLIRTFGVDESRVCVIPGGVSGRRFDLPHTRTDARIHLGWPRNRRIVLSVRRVTSRMGLEQLIDAAPMIRSRIPDVLLLIAGDGKPRGELQARIDALDLGSHVRLLGYLPDEHLALAFRAAELSVVPSIALEGFGMAAVESLAAGTPVVVTPVGGLPEIVRPFRPSLITADTGSQALADTISAALEHPLALPTAAECRRYAGRFDWPRVAPAISQLLCAVAKESVAS